VAWQDTELTRLLGVRLPIVQAPMAGGPTTPRLVAAVSEAGALGSLGAALLGPDELRDRIREVRALTGRPFAVNLFAPLPPPSERGLAEWAVVVGVPAPDPKPMPRFEDQIAVVVEERVRIFSFTFGIPPPDTLDGLDAVRIGTATTVAEAVALQAAGVHAVVAQGYEAGGHRGTFLGPMERSMIGAMALLPQVVDAVSVPVIASGGIMDGRGVAAALVLGAQAVQLGTAFLACDEAGISAEQREALSGETTVTRALTGRHARAVRTPLVDRLEASGLRAPDYPLARQFLPGPPMLAGQGGPLARRLPAGKLVETLAIETDSALRRLA
jgi:nitronate monooxygenase